MDELDKIPPSTGGDVSSLLEAMESQRVSLAKGSFYSSLHARTALIAAANPKNGNFKYTPLTHSFFFFCLGAFFPSPRTLSLCFVFFAVCREWIAVWIWIEGAEREKSLLSLSDVYGCQWSVIKEDAIHSVYVLSIQSDHGEVFLSTSPLFLLVFDSARKKSSSSC